MSEKMTAEEFAAIYGINIHRGSNGPESVVGCKLPIRPAWTSEPPTEPGWYWCRRIQMDGSYAPPETIHMKMCHVYGKGGPMLSAFYGDRQQSAGDLAAFLEFWPTPIPEPPR